MKKRKKNEKKPWLYRFIKRIVMWCYPKRKFIGLEKLPDEPALIIGNHAQMHGPLMAELWFPEKKRIWCIGSMMKVREVPAYAYADFWSAKPKRVRWIFRIASYLMAPLAAYIFTHADTIGVYKDSRTLNTFKETVNALKDGSHVIIFPEHAVKHNEIVYDFQENFIDVAKLYYKRTKKAIRFVPMYHAVPLKTVVFGEPVCYDPNADSAEERAMICSYLMDEITRLAKELPPHRVVTYENLSRRYYPMSK